MILVALGFLLIALKLAAVGPVAGFAWWLVCAPLAGAIVWWWYVDVSGLGKRREMARMDERKAKRRSGSLENLGIGPEAEKEKRRAEAALAARQREIEKVEARRAADRSRLRDSVLGSRFDSQQHSMNFEPTKR
ncbi:MAG: TIGR04438 family Trp-rich protein [Caldimonas sp.]